MHSSILVELKKIVFLAFVLVLLLITIIAFSSNVFAWSNGGYSDDQANPDYGTHDWIVEHALDWLPEEEKRYIVDNLAACLYGTELPDNGIAPDGIGDTAKHHIYYWSNGSLQDDASAVRADEEYYNTLTFLNSGQTANASKTAGVMSHYIVDMAVFGHVMGSATDWGRENHHSDYETYVNQRTDSYDDEFNTYLSFDGKLTILSAYDAAIGLAYDTTFDVIGDLTCVWMDQNYNWSNPTFKNRCGESLNLAVNYLTDVIHTLYSEIAPVHNTDSGMSFSTIQAAINDNDTSDGHTIFVEEGTYYEHVIVNKSVSLIGERRETTIIDGGGYGTVVRIWADGVKMSNFTIRNIGIPSPELPPPMDGISAHFSNGTISNNIIEHNGDGITLVFSANNTITGNRVSENEYGIRLDDSNNNTIASNDVSSNKKHGIYLWWDSNNNTLTDNKVSENEYGIYFDHSSNNALTDNEVSNNDYGIHLHHSPENVLIGNEVLNNKWGIYLNSSRINSIHHNNFFNNTFQACAFDSYNSWDDGYPSGGNYWSNYEERYPNATEIDGSGIWDTPYFIDENNQDNYPVVPEFPTWTSRLLILIVITVAVFIHKQRLLKTPKH